MAIAAMQMLRAGRYMIIYAHSKASRLKKERTPVNTEARWTVEWS